MTLLEKLYEDLKRKNMLKNFSHRKDVSQKEQGSEWIGSITADPDVAGKYMRSHSQEEEDELSSEYSSSTTSSDNDLGD